MDVVVDSSELNDLVNKLLGIVGSFKRHRHSLFGITEQEENLSLNSVWSESSRQIEERVLIEQTTRLASPVQNGCFIAVSHSREKQELLGQVFTIASHSILGKGVIQNGLSIYSPSKIRPRTTRIINFKEAIFRSLI